MGVSSASDGALGWPAALWGSSRRPPAPALFSRFGVGPRRLPLLGLLPALMHDPIGALSASAPLGDVVSLGAQSALGPRVYLLNHPEAARQVLVERSDRYGRPQGLMLSRQLIGDGLFSSEGEAWQHQRRETQHAFTNAPLSALSPLTAALTDQLLARWAQRAAQAEPVDLEEDMADLALCVVARALTGLDVSALLPTLRRALTTVLWRLHRAALLPLALPTASGRRVREALLIIEALAQGLIEARAQAPQGPDLLWRLLSAHAPWLLSAHLSAARTAAEDAAYHQKLRPVRDQLLTFLVAGYETVASGLTWLFELLAQHPQVEARVHEEIDALAGAIPTLADLGEAGRLGYTRRTLDEVLRLYPPGWVIPRKVLREDQVAGFRIPRGAVVILCPYLLHRHPGFWEAPERFDPDRFLPERSRARHRYAYLPFGAGPRRCIGQYFALLEMLTVVSRVARRVRLRPVGEPPQVASRVVVLRTREGALVHVLPRG